MVFDAHDKAFAFVGGACARGIYDSEPLARAAMAREDGGGHDLRGQGSRLQLRSPMSLGPLARHGSLQQMCGNYLAEPVACTPASGWEKGQVENQVGAIRRRSFVPWPRFRSYAELNAWLMDRCIACGRRLRILNVVDDVTKECLAAIVDTSISGRRVARELAALVTRRGRPDLIVSDHGTELTSNAMLAWTQETGIAWHFIAPRASRSRTASARRSTDGCGTSS